MTSPSSLLSRMEEIRKRLEKATPRPWVSDNDAVQWKPLRRDISRGASVTQRISEGNPGETIIVGGAQDEQGGAVGVLKNEDADFIAHAPSDIAYLLAELASTLQSAQAEEREACAKVAESNLIGLVNGGARNAVKRIASAIRARATKE